VAALANLSLGGAHGSWSLVSPGGGLPPGPATLRIQAQNLGGCRLETSYPFTFIGVETPTPTPTPTETVTPTPTCLPTSAPCANGSDCCRGICAFPLGSDTGLICQCELQSGFCMRDTDCCDKFVCGNIDADSGVGRCDCSVTACVDTQFSSDCCTGFVCAPDTFTCVFPAQ
jgi:hypothetical protein